MCMCICVNNLCRVDQLSIVMVLWFSSLSDRQEVYLGDENTLSLTFNARNEGEGGAYEAELYVVLPPEADYSGIARNNVVRQTVVVTIPFKLPVRIIIVIIIVLQLTNNKVSLECTVLVYIPIKI